MQHLSALKACLSQFAHFSRTKRQLFYTNENNGGNICNFINSTFNTISEKLIELYEWRIKDLEEKLQLLSKEKIEM